MSATLKTAKSIKVVANMSVTKPRKTRSMRLPTAPPRIRARESRPSGRVKSLRAISTATATEASREISASSQVREEKLEKAAPVFWM